jgi:hypothetical protein
LFRGQLKDGLFGFGATHLTADDDSGEIWTQICLSDFGPVLFLFAVGD